MSARAVTSVALVASLLSAGCQVSVAVGRAPSAGRTGAVRSAPRSGRKSPYAAAVSHPRRDPYYPAEGTTGLDALHYGLDLSWDAAQRRLSGTATIRFRATRRERSVSLDLAAPLRVDSVHLDGMAPRRYTHTGHKLTIFVRGLARNSRHTVRIGYAGRPRPVAAPTTRSDIPDLGWTVQPDGQAWSLQEPFGAFTWYPVNDQPSDKAFYDITWHTKPAWTGVSNGWLVSDRVTGGQRVTHWRLPSPAASYLVTVDIGPYRAHHQTGPHGLPITYWVRAADKDVLPALRHTPAMIRWLESHLGRYPFGSIGAVVAPTTSAEETQTMVTIGASVLRASYGLSDLLHEYSHQWYGDEVTPNNWKDLWLNESFAMYIQFRWEATHGMAPMWFWREQMNSQDQKLRTKYGPPGEYDRRNFAELNVYYCGARMLDRLHSMLGATMFAKVLRDWPHQNRFGSVDRNDWISYLDRTTGENLRSFVEQWLTSKTSPK